MRRCEARRLAPLWRGLALVGLAAIQTGSALAEEPVQVPAFLRLSDALDLALRGSAQVGVGQARLDAARSQRTAALFNLGPDLSVGGRRASSTRKDFDRPAVGLTQTEESSFRQYQGGTSVRLFDGFSNLARLSAARYDVRTDEYSLAYTRKQVQTNVIASYYNLLRAQLLLRVAEQAESVAREQLQRTQALFDLGSAARSDVLKSQVQHGNTRLDLVRAQNGVRQARVDLEYSMNITTTTAFQVDTTLAQVRPDSVDYESERTFAMQSREDLLSLRSAEKAAGRRVWAARGGLWPSLDFSYDITQTKSTSQLSLFQFGAAKSRNRQWAFSANWNLWDRYSTYASIGQARANSRIAEYNRRQAELDAVREIRTLVNSLEEARERLAVSHENVVRSNEDLRLAQEKFRVGAGTILDIITAESDLTFTKANEVQAIVDHLIARANLVRATGRPFSEL